MLDIDNNEIINDLKEDEKTFDRSYKEMKLAHVQTSRGLELLEILKLIETDKNYIFDFIMTHQIQKLIKSIKGCHKINKDEAEDVTMFVITEYFYEHDLNLNSFNESTFLNRFRSEVGKRVQKMMREGYSYKEIPADFEKENEKEEFLFDNFEDEILEKIDLNVAFNKLPLRSQRILELKFYERISNADIAKKIRLSRQRVDQIVNESCEQLKKYLQD